MAQKWHIVLFGIMICGGTNVGAMDRDTQNQAQNQVHRNPLGCSQEVKKEGAVIAVLRNSAERRQHKGNGGCLVISRGEAATRNHLPDLQGLIPFHYSADFPGKDT